MKLAKARKPNPEGRVDILVTNIVDRLIKQIESKYELPGLSEAIKPDVAKLTGQLFGKKPIHPLGRVALRKVAMHGTVQANQQHTNATACSDTDNRNSPKP